MKKNKTPEQVASRIINEQYTGAKPLQIVLTKVGGCEAIGKVSDDTLTPAQLDALGLTDESDTAQEVEVVVSYDVQFDEDVPMVAISSVTLFGAKNEDGKGYKHIELDEDEVDMDALTATIENSAYDFYCEYLERCADDLYDDWKENND